MNSFILIDGFAFWVLLIVFIMGFITCIFLGNGYLDSQRKLELKDRQLKNLKIEYNLLLGEYQKATFKVPTLKRDKTDGVRK